MLFQILCVTLHHQKQTFTLKTKQNIMEKSMLSTLVSAFVVNLNAENKLGGEVVITAEVTDIKSGTPKNRSLAYQKLYDTENQRWRVTKRTEYKNVTFQRNYANSCTNRADNETPYIAEKPIGRSWVKGLEGILLVSDKDPNKHYLRIAENKNTIRKTTYFVDGREATEDEIDLIKSHLYKKTYTCQKQLQYGIKEEDLVSVKDFLLANIDYIKFGKQLLVLR